MSKSIELIPVTGQKSFYGKAHVIIGDDGSETLRSYSTNVIIRTPGGKLYRLWDDWYATTGRHIKAFCGLNKAEYNKLPYYDGAAARAASVETVSA